MPHFELLSRDTWPVLAKRSKRRGLLQAAIAYVTADHLRLRTGDLLICDASDKAIRGGMTSAKVLENYVSERAKVYSIQGMHAKLATFDRYTFVGSANMSAGAGIRTLEASILTDNVQVRGLILAYIDELLADPTIKRVDELFIARIKKLPVSKRAPWPERHDTPGDPVPHKREAQVWWLATNDLSPRIHEEVQESLPEVAKGAAKALHKARKADSELDALAKKWTQDPRSLDSIVYRQNARILRQLQRGDVLVFCHTSPSGRSTVSQPATYLHTQVIKGRAHVIYRAAEKGRAKAWSVVGKRLSQMGSAIKATSTRRMKDRELEILDYLAT